MAHTTESPYVTLRPEASKHSTPVILSNGIQGRRICGGFMGGWPTRSSYSRDFRPTLYQSVCRYCSTLTFPCRRRSGADSPNDVSPEMIICRSPYVKYCAMFGTNRPCVGVLIEPDGDHVETFDPAEWDLLTRFRNSVW
jgi:hypothetical protein